MSRQTLIGVFLIAAIAACGDNIHPEGADAPPATPDGPSAVDAMPDAAAAEVCTDTIDNDGDGAIDCADSDCTADPSCNPEMMCNDTVDNDGDGATDCADSDCATAPNCLPEGLCRDGTDNDGDGATDCADPDCVAACLAGCADNESTVVIAATGLPQPVSDTLPPTDVTFDVAADGWISGGAVHFSITHTYDGDLDVDLASPAGNDIDLTSGNGGSGDNYTDTVLTDAAPDSITTGTAPFTGLFQPEELFSSIAGAAAMGTWHVTVTDTANLDDGTVDTVDLYLCVCNGTAGCETNIACNDGVDNDGDGQIDCTDPDCVAAVQCIPEADCSDGLDNDLDGATDCADSDCSGVGTCELPETTCDDGIDNDGDGLIDCADPECLAAALCGPEGDCSDGTDDDGDGLVDCADPGCAGMSGCELGIELTCDDGIDNDGDGTADCADTDCAGRLECAVTCPAGTSRQIYTATDVPVAIPDNMPTNPGISTITVPGTGLASAVAVELSVTQTYDADLDMFLAAPGGTIELSTDNGGSNDNYTATVFVDTAGTAITAGTAPFTGRFRPEQPLAGLYGTASGGDWQLRVGDDAGGDTGSITEYRLLVCECDAASGTCEFGPIACRNGTDDDGNGLVDCADPGCAADPTCSPEANCTDGVDNDLDGNIDCTDPDCNGVSGCELGLELTCTDGVDNDGDGTTDCADPDCVANPACIVEVVCNNGIDDDGDGLVDCVDPDCAAGALCQPESDCTDGIDNDGDGNTDCLDQGCDGLQGCELGTELSCDDGFDNDGDGPADCADSNCSALFICSIGSCPAGTAKEVYTAIDVPKAIPDNAATTPAVVTITIPTTGLTSVVAVGVSVAHTYDADVDMFLAAPGGTIELSTDNGSSGDNYTSTVFVDSAATAITTGAVPFSGRFRPEAPLASLSGTSVGGDWSLRVGDDAGGDVGSITAYQLLVCQCDAASGACEFGAIACRNGTDDDGNGLIDCADPGCAADITCLPESACGDGSDNDLDGSIDCADADCATGIVCGPTAVEHACNDGLDEDGNGLTDCADPNCSFACGTFGATCIAGSRLLAYRAEMPRAVSSSGTPIVDSFFPVGIAGPIVTAAVRFDATHTYDADIDLSLLSPGGTTLDLTSDNGSSADNYTQTVLIDTATTAITAGAAPFTGQFRPEQAFALLTGQASNGLWRARLADDAGGDGGTWNEFSLALCVGP